MENLEKLNDIYNCIEKAYNYVYLSNAIFKLSNLLDIYSEKDILNKIQWELSFLSCNIKYGKLESDSSFLSENMSSNQIHYLQKRYNFTNNLFLKSIYALIISDYYNKKIKEDKSDKNYKNNKINFIHNSIDNLIDLLDYYKANNYEYKFHYNDMIKDTIINIYTMGKMYKYKEDKCEHILLTNIYDESIETRIKLDLIDFAISKKELLKGKLDGLDDYCWEIYENSDKVRLDTILELGKKVSLKIKSDKYNWNEELGKYFEDLADKRKDDNFIKYEFYRDANHYYKLSNNKSKQKELDIKLDNLATNINFPKFKMLFNNPCDENMINKELSNKKEYTFEDLMNYLIYNEDFPLMVNLNKDDFIYNIREKNNPLLPYFKIISYDSNRNPRSSYMDKSEKVTYENENIYKIHIEKCIVPYLNELFLFFYKNKILNYESFINYLNKYDWEIKQKHYSNDLLYYLKPIFKDFFKNLECISLSYEFDENNFILFIDSMILKIEFIIREICKRNNISIRNHKKDISEIKNLNDLLKDEDLKNIFNEKDFDFLKFILINQSFNLRNIIAHSLNIEIYNFSTANLIILSFLRLLKYL